MSPCLLRPDLLLMKINLAPSRLTLFGEWEVTAERAVKTPLIRAERCVRRSRKPLDSGNSIHVYLVAGLLGLTEICPGRGFEWPGLSLVVSLVRAVLFP